VVGVKLGTTAIWVMEMSQKLFNLLSDTGFMGPDVPKDIFLQESNVFSEGMVFDSILLVWFFAFCFLCKFCHRGLTTVRNGPQQD
jgi:hypothetical protein